MRKEDLIKKLENIKTPEIEIQSHKERLKVALLNSGYFKEEKIMNPIMFWTKRLVPVGAALALILAIGFSVIQPKFQIARAMEIAKKDPQIQQLMKDYGVEIKQVKLEDGKAYVLLTFPEEKLSPVPRLEGEETSLKKRMRGPGQFFIAYQDPKTGEIIESSGSVAEIDLKAKKVKKLEMVKLKKFRIAPLTEEEKTRAIEIAKSDPKVQKMIPDLEKREIIVRPLPPLKLRLEKDSNGRVKVNSANPNEEKRVNVIFKSDKYQDVITVNLTSGKVEGAVSYSRRIKKRPQSEYPVPIKPHPSKPKFYLERDGIGTSLPDEGVVIMEHENEGLTANQKEIFAKMLKDIAEKDERIKDLLKDNDYEILDVIKSKPIVEKTKTSETIRVKTATVVLEKESTGEDYWITIDLGSMTVKSIEKE